MKPKRFIANWGRVFDQDENFLFSIPISEQEKKIHHTLSQLYNNEKKWTKYFEQTKLIREALEKKRYDLANEIAKAYNAYIIQEEHENSMLLNEHLTK